MAFLTTGSVLEGGDVTVMGRLVDGNNANVTQSGVTSIQREVWSVTGTPPTKVGSTDTLVVASTVFNSLQTGGAWVADDTVYNFRNNVPASAMPTISKSEYPAKKRVAIHYMITLTGGAQLPHVVEVEMSPSLFGD